MRFTGSFQQITRNPGSRVSRGRVWGVISGLGTVSGSTVVGMDAKMLSVALVCQSTAPHERDAEPP